MEGITYVPHIPRLMASYQFQMFIQRDTTWEKIEHVRNVKIEDKKINQS